ncbi:hypothetical protein ACT3XG_14745 [Paenibacillus polymyxa]|nr:MULTISPECIES: hypothetical protein [Paenibacillus]MEE4566798.1 hypothetical protein [Paenibacillus polymyxa]MEE4578845.1 hypothetical protein [Paenibacillus polymyxa]WHX33933.1 hypothetical protein QNH38_15180 [Paenibacillus polymyxa]
MNNEQFIIWLRAKFAERVKTGCTPMEKAVRCMKTAREFVGL